MSGEVGITDVQQRRIAALRIARVSKHLTLEHLRSVSDDDHVRMGLVAELMLNGFLVKDYVGETERWRWTAAAEYALEIFEPRKGKHE